MSNEPSQQNENWIYYIAQIGHEIRTPLNVIHGFGQLLSSESIGPLNEQQKTYLNKILASADDLLDIINQILDWASLSTDQAKMNMEEMDLWILIMEMSDFFHLSFENAHLNVSFDVERDLVVYCDRNRIKQVLINIIGNAIKYVPAGGQVCITARRTDRHCVISIEDNGPGISEEDRRKIFEPFNRGTHTHGRKQGTGLGLWTSQAIMHTHGGEIIAEPVEEGGIRFNLLFPLNRG